MNPRRLDVEAYRDCLLQASGTLDPTPYGPSADLDQPGNNRRTVYARVGRGRAEQPASALRLPRGDDAQPGPRGDHHAAPAVVRDEQRLHAEPGVGAGQARGARSRKCERRVRAMYRKVLGRDPDETELKLGGRILRRRRHARAIRPGPSEHQRGDILAMITPVASRRRLHPVARLRAWASVGLMGMLAEQSAARGGRAAPCGAATGPHFAAAGEAQHRPVPARRAVAHGPVRPEARPGKVRRAAARLGEPADRAHHRRAASPRRSRSRSTGRAGIDVSELLPKIASIIDDICVVKSMYTFNPTHTPARSLFHSGNIAATRPSMGSWISYGLGTENQNLPGLRGARPRRRRRAGGAERVSAGALSGHRLRRLADASPRR